MQGIHLRKYGVETKIDFELYEVDGVDFRIDAVDAGSDCTIMKDEGAEVTCANDFIDEGKGYSITLTATEMQAARIVIYIVDSVTKAWLDKTIIIESYGHTLAQHAFDLDTPLIGAGAITFTYTLTSSIDPFPPIPDADVWVTTDIGGSIVVASGKTDQNGQIVFYLDAGTVYVWRQKSGWDFVNPDTEVIS